jgi:hypothetical protein
MLKKHAVIAVGLLLALVFSSSAYGQYGAQYGGRWDRLGEAHVDGGQDHDTIRVGHGDGKFRAIQLRVSGGEIFFERVVVRYGNGQIEELAIRDRIPAGGATRVIDLPGDRRVIESVDLWYGKARWEHRPKVTLLGLR